ncbi:hypothetical protein Nmel_009001 [Mimus melanotis]
MMEPRVKPQGDIPTLGLVFGSGLLSDTLVQAKAYIQSYPISHSIVLQRRRRERQRIQQEAHREKEKHGSETARYKY